jgi:hypothetical protein
MPPASAFRLLVSQSGTRAFWYRTGPLIPVPDSPAFQYFKKEMHTLCSPHVHTTSKGLGYTLHVHTAGGAYCWSWIDTLQVNTVCSGRGYNLHILTPGGEKGYTLHVHTAGVKRHTPCTSILLAVERDTPCTSILLAVERDTPCTSILHGCGRGYTLHDILLAWEGETSILLDVERDTLCTSILLVRNRYTLHVNTVAVEMIHPARQYCWQWKWIHPARPYCWRWKGMDPACPYCWW